MLAQVTCTLNAGCFILLRDRPAVADEVLITRGVERIRGCLMRKTRILLGKAITPITILVIPHDSLRALNLRVPTISLVLTILLSAIGGIYVSSLAVRGLKYEAQHLAMTEKVQFYTEQFGQWDATVTTLKKIEKEFQRLFALNSREEVLANADTSFSGSLDIPDLVEELKKTTESVDEIKDFLRIQKDIYVATPKGYPVSGNISSGYGRRIDPLNGEAAFHSGIDISSSPGGPILATADGLVSHSGWTPQSGFVVVLEHGCGFSTIYAHNKRNNVRVSQRVKSGDIIGYVGSTGKTTGPHVHYEVWKDGKNINPADYLTRRAQ